MSMEFDRLNNQNFTLLKIQKKMEEFDEKWKHMFRKFLQGHSP